MCGEKAFQARATATAEALRLEEVGSHEGPNSREALAAGAR